MPSLIFNSIAFVTLAIILHAWSLASAWRISYIGSSLHVFLTPKEESYLARTVTLGSFKQYLGSV